MDSGYEDFEQLRCSIMVEAVGIEPYCRRYANPRRKRKRIRRVDRVKMLLTKVDVVERVRRIGAVTRLADWRGQRGRGFGVRSGGRCRLFRWLDSCGPGSGILGFVAGALTGHEERKAGHGRESRY